MYVYNIITHDKTQGPLPKNQPCVYRKWSTNMWSAAPLPPAPGVGVTVAAATTAGERTAPPGDWGGGGGEKTHTNWMNAVHCGRAEERA